MELVTHRKRQSVNPRSEMTVLPKTKGTLSADAPPLRGEEGERRGGPPTNSPTMEQEMNWLEVIRLGLPSGDLNDLISRICDALVPCEPTERPIRFQIFKSPGTERDLTIHLHHCCETGRRPTDPAGTHLAQALDDHGLVNTQTGSFRTLSESRRGSGVEKHRTGFVHRLIVRWRLEVPGRGKTAFRRRSRPDRSDYRRDIS